MKKLFIIGMVPSVNKKTDKYPIEHHFGMKILIALGGFEFARLLSTFIGKQLMCTIIVKVTY